jgi:hypothetical protein
VPVVPLLGLEWGRVVEEYSNMQRKGNGPVYMSWGLPREQAGTSVTSWARLEPACAQAGSWAGEMT